MSTQSFQLSAKTTQNIIAKRKIFRVTDAKAPLKFEIQGNGNTIPMVDKNGVQVVDQQGIPLMKTIYNTRVNSHVAMLNPRNKAILLEAMTAETAGNTELAHDKFNQYLNKIQVSFSVILNNGRKNPVFHNGDLVKGRVELVTTDNGQLLTLENNTVSLVHIEEAEETSKFTLSDLMGLDSTAPTPESVFTPIEGATTTTETVGS